MPGEPLTVRWTEGGSHRTEGCGLGHRLPPSMSDGASQGVCGRGARGWVPRKGEWGSKARGEKAPRVPAELCDPRTAAEGRGRATEARRKARGSSPEAAPRSDAGPAGDLTAGRVCCGQSAQPGPGQAAEQVKVSEGGAAQTCEAALRGERARPHEQEESGWEGRRRAPQRRKGLA